MSEFQLYFFPFPGRSSGGERQRPGDGARRHHAHADFRHGEGKMKFKFSPTNFETILCIWLFCTCSFSLSACIFCPLRALIRLVGRDFSPLVGRRPRIPGRRGKEALFPSPLPVLVGKRQFILAANNSDGGAGALSSRIVKGEAENQQAKLKI